MECALEKLNTIFSRGNDLKGFYIMSENKCLRIVENLKLKWIILIKTIKVQYEAINDNKQN